MKPPVICWDARRNCPAIDQHAVNGFEISWNPDDTRFYVCDRPGPWNDLETRATFKELRNARAFAKRNTPRG